MDVTFGTSDPPSQYDFTFTAAEPRYPHRTIHGKPRMAHREPAKPGDPTSLVYKSATSHPSRTPMSTPHGSTRAPPAPDLQTHSLPHRYGGVKRDCNALMAPGGSRSSNPPFDTSLSQLECRSTLGRSTHLDKHISLSEQLWTQSVPRLPSSEVLQAPFYEDREWDSYFEYLERVDFQSITAAIGYRHTSFEEMRVEDYGSGRRHGLMK